MSCLSHLECGSCGKEYGADRVWNLCPEGGATLAAFNRLCDQGWIEDGETVVLFNTGSGLKYAHLWT